MRSRFLPLLLALSACGGSGSAGSGGSGGQGGFGGTGGTGGEGGSGGVFNEAERQAEVCSTWHTALANLPIGSWSGGNNLACIAGDNPVGRASAIKLVNAYRFLADLDPVVDDPTVHKQAQACALIMGANGQLSHFPDSSWRCYTAAGLDGSSHSNIATAEGVYAVHLYMTDGGANNEGTLGHRRWLLAPGLKKVGPGTTDTFSCIRVVDEVSGTGSQLFVAWPPPGPVPIEVVSGDGIGAGSLDDTGWSIQTDAVDLSAAQVHVTHEGLELPVVTAALAGGYGSAQALKFTPSGWRSTAGETYAVHVSGSSLPIDYAVKMVSCR